MNKLIIPPSPNWYLPRIIACAPDNTIVYGARNDLVVINPTDDDEEANIKIVNAHYERVISVDAISNWNKDNKLVISSGDDKVVSLWDMNTYECIRSLNTHTSCDDKLIGTVFAGNDKIVSASEHGFVSLWRFHSNEVVTYKSLFNFRVRITVISSCPHSSWLMAVGLDCGLIVIVDLRKCGRIIYRLRGHDRSIVSLSWCPTPFNVLTKKVPLTTSREGPECPRQFRNGTKSSTSNESNKGEIAASTLAGGGRVVPVVVSQENNSAIVAANEKLGFQPVVESASITPDKQNVSNGSSGEDSQDNELKTGVSITIEVESAEVQIKEKPADYEGQPINLSGSDNGKEEPACCLEPGNSEGNVQSSDVELDNEVEGIFQPEKEYLLASSARGGSILIWRAGTNGRKQLELTLPSNKARRWVKGNEPWITLCWITPETLLSSTPKAELLQWDLLGSTDAGGVGISKKKIHSDHNKNLFAIVAPVKILQEWEDKNCREKKDLFAWTVGQEKYVLCTSLQANRKVLFSLPTTGGHIYTLVGSPVDPTRLSAGCWDNTSIWDLSRPHRKSVTMTNLTNRVYSKVMALAWHPQNETRLAFATLEGRIGLIDTNNPNQTPILLSQYFRSAVYNIEWGPMKDDNGKMGLYATGEGKLVVYDVKREKEDPFVVELPSQEYVHCISWKECHTRLACATKSGTVFLFDNNLKHVLTIYSEHKSIFNVVWHPLATVSDTGVSLFSSWLAISCSSSSVVVFDVSQDINPSEGSDNRTVAVLNCHLKPVRCICWSPHASAVLASGGDDGVIIVWDVERRSVLHTFLGHDFESIFCVYWSPLKPNLVLSTGKDNCIRIWDINEHGPLTSAELEKAQQARLRTRKDKRAVQDREVKEESPKVKRDSILFLTSRLQNRMPEEALDDCVEMYRMVNDGVVEDSHFDKRDERKKTEINPLNLFGPKDEVVQLLDVEKQKHSNKANSKAEQHIDLWKGDIADMVNKAIENGTVTPWLISLAPAVSHKSWQKACEVYVNKHIDDGKTDPLELSSYLLAIHRVNDAIKVLCDATLFREALALAKCRLLKTDPIFDDILNQWATWGIVNGAFEISVQCFIKLGKYEEAAKALFRRTNLDSLRFSIVLAQKSNNKDLLDACTLRYNSFKEHIEYDLQKAREESTGKKVEQSDTDDTVSTDDSETAAEKMKSKAVEGKNKEEIIDVKGHDKKDEIVDTKEVDKKIEVEDKIKIEEKKESVEEVVKVDEKGDGIKITIEEVKNDGKED